MARTRVNLIVGAGSAATLAASFAGIARADGYWIAEGADQPAAAVAALSAEPPVIEPAPSESSAATAVSSELTVTPALTAPVAAALPPLAPLQIAPAPALRIAPMPQVFVRDLSSGDLPSGSRGAVDVTGFVPTPALAPAQPSVVTAAPPPQPAPAAVAPPPAA
ncbi:MAG: hypothetical protein O3A10_10050, partial [Chloroflexi bacterium]|nr:hypothetical protein [Chloroflexota bacterium]